MKLLFDQNLSFKLVQKLAVIYPGSNHVRLLGLDQADDEMVWEYARLHDYTMVTQDGDYSNLSNLRGFPPKIIWLRGGNRPTSEIDRLLRHHQLNIRRFLGDPMVGCLEIG